jgi:DNA repair exonuclease SbcCD ATPase subunit
MTLLSFMGKREDGAPAATLQQLERLLGDIQTERRSLEAVLSTAATTDLSDMRSGLDHVQQRGTALGRELDELGRRLERLAETAVHVESVEQRLARLEDRLAGAEAKADETARTTADAVDTGAALEGVIARAHEASHRLEALQNDSDIGRFVAELPGIKEEIQRVREQHTALLSGADALKAKAAAVLQEATTAADTASRASDRVADVTRQLTDLQYEARTLAQLDTARQDASVQLQALNALNEHVSTKVKALEGQSLTIERALIESRRLGEMLWQMEAQVARLNEGTALVGRVEEDLGRLERLRQDVLARTEEAARSVTDFDQKADQQQRGAAELLQTLQGHMEGLRVRKQEVETLFERLRAIQGGLAEAERRLTTVASAEGTASVVAERVDELAGRLGALATRADACEQKQAVVSLLEERLDRADSAARRTNVQIESLLDRQKDLDRLESAFAAADQTYAATRVLVDTLRDEKRDFDQFVERASEFMRDAPQIEATVTDLHTRVAAVQEEAARAVAMAPEVEAVAGRLSGLTPRLQLLDELQGRLARLHQLSVDIDQRIASQLGRHAELERMRAACDGLATQAADAQHRLDGLEQAQHRLEPLGEKVAQFDADVAAARTALAALQQESASIAALERRMNEFRDVATGLASELAGRLDVVRELQADLGSAAELRQALYGDLAQLQAQQRQASATARDTEGQLEQLAQRCLQIEERRAHLATIEQDMTAVEDRISTLDHLANRIDTKVTALAERDRLVDAVRQEVEAIHLVSRQAHEELASVTGRRVEMAEAGAELERLADALADTAGKMADVERRGIAVEEVRRKADTVARLLDDVRLTLDAVGEQKATAEHLAETMTRLEDVISEARGATKALRSERKLAQRIADNVRTIHARAGDDIRQAG